jgi:hypothetical protein
LKANFQFPHSVYFHEANIIAFQILTKKSRCLHYEPWHSISHNFCRSTAFEMSFCVHIHNTPQQNSVAERNIWHLVKTCKIWLYVKNLPKALWAKGMAYAACVINQVSLSSIDMKSPNELIFFFLKKKKKKKTYWSGLLFARVMLYTHSHFFTPNSSHI